MQYDNYSNPVDGWEFDAVQIREEIEQVTPVQPPVVPPTTLPAGSDFAETALGYWSIGSADTADGTVPNNRLARDTTTKVQGAASIRFSTPRRQLGSPPDAVPTLQSVRRE